MGFLLKLLRHGQRLLVYPSGFLDEPDRINTPYSLGLPYEYVILTTKDKVKLECYLIRRDGVGQLQRSRGTIIMCHGNAMNHGDILPEAQWLFMAGFNVFTLEYRGYGNNRGCPSEKGLRLDAQAAVDFILSHPILSVKPLIMFGQSLGGAVAIDVASRNASKIQGLVIENTFTSIPDLVKGLPVLRHVSFLCTQRWNSRQKISRMPSSLPILMLSGLLDQVVPSHHMQGLWSAAEQRPSKTKRADDNGGVERLDKIVQFPRGDHNTTWDQPGYRNVVLAFLDDIVPI